MRNARGYIALYRDVLDHPLFKDERPYTRFQAWVWMIQEAAWGLSQQRVGRTVTTVERGQLAATTRGLGETWGWAHGRVRRFLETLRREAMIRTLVTDTVAGTETGTPSRTGITIITICNYSKFQSAAAQPIGEQAQHPTRRQARNAQQALDLADEIRPEEPNQPTKIKIEKRFGEKSGGKSGGKYTGPPRHGQTSEKHGTIFIKIGTDEWVQYAADFKRVRGEHVPLLPNRDGGYWFFAAGEAERPPQQRGWRRRA
jgi:hypothetical protein